jgi:hypothetical protein
MNGAFSRFLAPLMVAALLLPVTACDSGPIAPEEEVLTVHDMILRAGADEFIYSHTDHWHGAPVVVEGDENTFDLFFSSVRMPVDDHDMPPIESWVSLAQHPGHDVRVVIQDTTLARWSGDSARGTLHGLRPGASVISFVVRRGTTTIYEAPPLNFRVQAR